METFKSKEKLIEYICEKYKYRYREELDYSRNGYFAGATIYFIKNPKNDEEYIEEIKIELSYQLFMKRIYKTDEALKFDYKDLELINLVLDSGLYLNTKKGCICLPNEEN